MLRDRALVLILLAVIGCRPVSRPQPSAAIPTAPTAKHVADAPTATFPTIAAGTIPPAATLQAYLAGCDGIATKITADPNLVAWVWFLGLFQRSTDGKSRYWETGFQQVTQVYLPPVDGKVPAPTWN